MQAKLASTPQTDPPPSRNSKLRMPNHTTLFLLPILTTDFIIVALTLVVAAIAPTLECGTFGPDKFLIIGTIPILAQWTFLLTMQYDHGILDVWTKTILLLFTLLGWGYAVGGLVYFGINDCWDAARLSEATLMTCILIIWLLWRLGFGIYIVLIITIPIKSHRQ